MSALDDEVLVVDTSAFVRQGHPRIHGAWNASLRAGRLLICPPVELELLYNARDRAAVDAASEAFALLRRVPLTDSCARAAAAAIRELAGRGPAGSHRVRPMDALVAACAQEVGAGVLHYDHHYDRLADVMKFESRWILPPGTV